MHICGAWASTEVVPRLSDRQLQAGPSSGNHAHADDSAPVPMKRKRSVRKPARAVPIAFSSTDEAGLLLATCFCIIVHYLFACMPTFLSLAR